MSTPEFEQVLAEIRALGVTITVANGKPAATRPTTTTIPTDEAKSRFADLLPLLKLHRTSLVSYFTRSQCRVCGKVCRDDEDRERQIDPAFCDRGGDWKEAVPRCPYKPDPR